ncbi:MAG: VCBS repeat-containing protein [Planctomycetes bacterium]|nr:VCBS repeat-containing protein [Planctomycetota bacterium]
MSPKTSTQRTMTTPLHPSSRRPLAPAPSRRALLASARRVLWDLLRRSGEARPLPALRAVLRRRLGEFLRASAAGRLLAILRSAAVASAVAAALLSGGPASAQNPEYPAIELAAIARGEGGFVARGDGEPASQAGRSVAAAGDVNGDGLPDLIVGGTCSSSAPIYVIFGKVDGAPIELSEVEAGRGGFAIRGSAERDLSGESVSGAGDVNGDGLADLLIGAPYASPGGRESAGESYVVFGKRDGAPVELSEVEAGLGGFAVRGSAERDLSGSSVSGAGDVNGDGLADLLIGAPYASPGGRDRAGESYVVFGKRDGAPVELSEVQAGRGGFAIRGVAEIDKSGFNVSGAGDVNGDGVPDFLVGAPQASLGGRYWVGETYVVFGKADGAPVELSEVQVGRGGFAIRGVAQRDFSDLRVSGVGDVNGDGVSDLLVGAPYASRGGRDPAGESYVVFGKADGAPIELSEVQAGRGGFAIRGSAERDLSGSSVSGAGDVNGDGLADLLIGAPYASPGGRGGAGETYIVFGKADGAPVELSEVQASRGGFAIRGVAAGERSGSSVSGAGDMNGDGVPDLLVAAGLQEARYPSHSGAAYVVFGPRREGSPRFRRGDSNADGTVDISDAITTLGFLFLGNPLELACRDAADANDDGDMDVSDAIWTLTFKFLGSVEIPAPGPDTCGIDPTADGLPLCSYDPTKC